MCDVPYNTKKKEMMFLAFIAKIFIDFPCRMDGPVAGQLGGTRDTGGWLTPILLTVAGDLLQVESDLFKTTLEMR